MTAMFDPITLARPLSRFPNVVRDQLRAGAKVETVAKQHGVPTITILFIAEAFAQAGVLAEHVADRIASGRQ